MNDLIVVQKIAGWEKLKALVLDSVSSPITKRVYNMALNVFLAWVPAGAAARLHQGHRERVAGIAGGPRSWLVVDHHSNFGDSQAGSLGGRQRTARAGARGWNRPRKEREIRGHTHGQLAVSAPGTRTTQRARRQHREGPARSRHPSRSSRVRATAIRGRGADFTHVQQRDGRWCIVDLKGKHGRVRTAPMPTWVKLAIDAWTSAASIVDSHVVRAVNRTY
jgi:hypothetical protein